MYLILFVLDNPDRLEDLLIAWEETGIQSATVLFSTGMGRIRQLDGWRDDMPLIPSIGDFYEIPENMNRTIFTTAKDEAQVDAIVETTKKVVGNLDEGESGLLLVLPVARAYGVNKSRQS
ncbi:MAG TPA: hypothetical protein VMN99_06135 [Anaerolineales bacterium]|nr:hypothetical protein [Anaerolineales bacterium]